VLVCHVSSGWRVGWAIAPAFLASAIRNIHKRVTEILFRHLFRKLVKLEERIMECQD